MITQEYFDKKCAKFEILEPRGGFYDLAVNLCTYGFKAEGALLLLATWNNSHFRYYVNKFDIQNFKDKLFEIEPIFHKLKDETFLNSDFKSLEKEINGIYAPLSGIEGVSYTGASKIMHLMNRELFAPWDEYIRDKYCNGKKDVQSYMNFLDKMQKKFGHLKAPECKTLAKAIDEYNYVAISVPATRKKSEEVEKRKKAKKKEIEEFKEWKKSHENE